MSSSPVNVLWKKEKSPSSNVYVDIFNIEGHEVNLRIFHVAYEISKESITYPKNPHLVKTVRECGKDIFKDGDYQMAMFTFNTGIPHIQADSEELGIAYANRSLCFLRMDMPEKALIDIELAKKSNYPANLMYKLTARENKCKALLEDEEFKANRFTLCEPTLSFNEHGKFAGVADCLEIHKSDDFGYHVITTRDLEIGQAVLVEPSYAITPKRMENIACHRCWNCYKDLQNFIPCENQNTIGTLYCNKDCEEKSFHRYECGLPNFSRKETTDLVQKIVHKLIFTFPDIDLLMKTVEALLKDDDVTDLTSQEQKNFCSVFKLIDKYEQKPDQQENLLTPSAHTFVMIMQIPDFAKMFQTKQKSRFLQHLILHLHHVTKYAFDLHEYRPTRNDELITGSDFVQYGSAVYPFATYIKHSCVPNVMWYSIDNRLICKVIRPIKMGEQVFRSYLPATKTFQYQHGLEIGPIEEQYNFKCQCSQCSGKPFDEVDYASDSQWIEGLVSLEMKIKDFQTLSRAAIDEYEQKAIELVKKYNDIPLNCSTCQIQDNLMLIWILRSQHF